MVYTWRMRIKAARFAKFGGIAITLGVLIIITVFFDLEALRDQIAKAGVWAPLLFILLKASTVVVAPLSGGPLYPLIGAFFGFGPGLVYAIIGDFIGYTIAFFISRKLGYPVVRKFIESNERSLLPKIVKHVGTPAGFFQACISLGFVPDLLSYGAGLSKLPYPIFISIIAPLSAVVSTVLVLLGASFGDGDSAAHFLIVPVVAILCMSVGGYFFLRAVTKKDPAEPPTL